MASIGLARQVKQVMEQLSQEDDKPEKKRILSAAVIGSAADTVQRGSSAVKEHLVAYSGADNENGVALKKSLKGISKEGVHPDYQSQNLKQQAGYSAEVKETANSIRNAI